MTARLSRVPPFYPDALTGAGSAILIIFLFSVFSAALDLIRPIAMLRPMLLLAFAGLGIVALKMRLPFLVQTRPGFALVVFTGWMVLCIPFSIWPGGAFGTFIEEWQKSALIYPLTAGLIYTYAQCRRALDTVAWGIVLLSCLCLYKNNQVFGRIMLGDTRYANPNDVAMVLLTGLPFLGLIALTGNKARRVLAGICFLPVLLCLAKTGSRAGMIGAAVMLMVVFYYAPARFKFVTILGVPAALLLAAILLPADVRDRYFTLFSSHDDQVTNSDIAAIESAESRWQLLKDSLVLTVRNPILGVGPGQFPVAQDKIAVARGERKGSWHVTHNTYTQVSCETGIPGLLFYAGSLLFGWQMLSQILSINRPGDPHWRHIQLMAISIRMSLASFFAVAFFGSFAYLPVVPIVIGIIVALSYAARLYLQDIPAAAHAAAPVLLRPRPQPVPAGSLARHAQQRI